MYRFLIEVFGFVTLVNESAPKFNDLCRVLGEAGPETLRKSLKDVDFFDSSPPREDLPSIGFYWVVSACVKGKFTQNAFLWPHKKFKAAQFGKLLSAWDFTDIPVNPPRETSHLSVYGTNDSEEFINDFNLKFGSNGLIRHTVLF